MSFLLCLISGAFLSEALSGFTHLLAFIHAFLAEIRGNFEIFRGAVPAELLRYLVVLFLKSIHPGLVTFTPNRYEKRYCYKNRDEHYSAHKPNLLKKFAESCGSRKQAKACPA
jgi:hypothetical protein